MRMMVIAAVALLLLGGGGAGAYFYFMSPAEASIGEEEADSHNKGTDTRAKKEEKARHNEHAEFLELDPLILPIVDDNGVSQVVSLVIALEVADSNTKEEVKAIAPRLKDAFIQDMYGVLNEHAALKGGVIQVQMLKERLNRISTEIAGEDKIHDVLLQVVQQRPI